MSYPLETARPQTQSELRYTRLKKTILLSMILVPVAIYIVALGIGFSYFVASLQDNSISHMRRILGDHRQMIDTFLEERKGDLALVLDAYSYEELQNPDVLRRLLSQLQKKSTAFVDLGIFDTQGVHVNYQGPYDLSHKVYRDEYWFKAVMENDVFISDVFLGFRNIPHFVIAMVKHTPTQTWIIRSTIDTVFFNMLVEQVNLGRTGEAYIINAQGLLQTQPRSGGSLMTPETINQDKPVYHRGMNVTIQPDQKGNDYLMATTWLKNKLWMLVVKQDKSDAFQSLHSAIYVILVITILGILIIVLVSFYFTTRIIRNLEKMDSEKQDLRFQLIHTSGLAELGEMATGFAHEINNPLQIIKNEQALIQMNITELAETCKIEHSNTLAELEDSIAQISLQIDRCAMITQSILKFGRRSEPTVENLDLRRFIPEIISIVDKRASLQNIDIVFEASPFPSFVNADPAQLQQVFLNIFNNAIDAINEKNGTSGGSIIIQIEDMTPASVDVTIADNGSGISPENLKKIFTPFFTTKPAGKGTGLGLSVCYGIIKNMGGEMSVISSNSSEGTVFKLTLPTGTKP